MKESNYYNYKELVEKATAAGATSEDRLALVNGKLPYKTVAYFNNYEIFTTEEINKYADDVWGKCDMTQW